MDELTNSHGTAARSTDANEERHRLLYTGIICTLGVVIASFHVPHFFDDIREGMGAMALISGALLPFVLAIVIVTAGYWAWKSGMSAPDIRRLVIWAVVGIISLMLISGTFFIYTLIEGGRLPHLDYTLLNFATTGAVVGIAIGWYDVRGRERMRQLRVFRKAVEHAGHSIYLTTRDGSIEYANPAFETQTGFDRDEVLGKTPRILKSGKHDESYYEELWETILSAEIWDDEVINKRKDGSYRYVDQTVAPVTDEYGNVVYFVAINNDITEMKEYEAELERQNERLDQFASVISHDLRNPLSVAMTRTELARRDADNEHLDKVIESLDRMETLIDDVLTLARQGESIGNPAPVQLSVIAKRAWKQVAAPEATLSVETEIAVMADGSRLQQLFENLFRNAVEHGGNDVTVRVTADDDAFSIEDDGSGIEEDTPAKVFESGHTTTEEGTGLGLAIVEQIVEAHGWEIEARESETGGARFDIRGVETREVSHASTGSVE